MRREVRLRRSSVAAMHNIPSSALWRLLRIVTRFSWRVGGLLITRRNLGWLAQANISEFFAFPFNRAWALAVGLVSERIGVAGV